MSQKHNRPSDPHDPNIFALFHLRHSIFIFYLLGCQTTWFMLALCSFTGNFKAIFSWRKSINVMSFSAPPAIHKFFSKINSMYSQKKKDYRLFMTEMYWIDPFLARLQICYWFIHFCVNQLEISFFPVEKKYSPWWFLYRPQ